MPLPPPSAVEPRRVCFCLHAIDSLNKLASTIVPRSEWENSYKERERRRNEDHKRVCQKLDELSMGQREIEKGLAKLYGLLENSHRATE